MKKLILAFTLLAFLTVSCGGGKKDQSAQEAENLKMETKADSISTVIESVQKEIDESSKKLDDLLSDL